MWDKNTMTYTFRMNNLFILLFALTFGLCALAKDGSLRTIVRFEKTSTSTKAIPHDQSEALPVRITEKRIQAQFDSMKEGEEAVIQGRIEYEVVSTDGMQQMRPYFIIESIHAVSLKEIGIKLTFSPVIDPLISDTQTSTFIPAGIPVTTEVASAITLTSSLLLMESLSSGSGDPSGRSDLRKAVFISAGAMATLLFIYEQLKGKSKP